MDLDWTLASQQQWGCAVTKEAEGNPEKSPKFERVDPVLELQFALMGSTIVERFAVPNLSWRHAILFVLVLAAPLFAASTRSGAVEKVPLALKGYDPVAYFTIGKPSVGLPEIEYVWDEHRYRFSRAEHRKLFKADPVRYAPQFANFCAMALTRGEVHEANPEYWLISDGKLFIFSLATGPERFRQSLTKNVSKANQNRPLIEKR
jgi:hypothetical protein